MRYKTIFIALFFLMAFIACGQKEDMKPAVMEKTEKALDYTYSQKDEFVKETRAKLDRVNTELKELETKAGTLKKDAFDEAKQEIQALRNKAVLLNKQIKKAGNATESTWDEVQNDFNKTYAELKESVGLARAWISEKIAP